MVAESETDANIKANHATSIMEHNKKLKAQEDRFTKKRDELNEEIAQLIKDLHRAQIA